ncbi:MAG: hypothetical protein ACQERS_10915, partial [Bacteroidota bacterium]
MTELTQNIWARYGFNHNPFDTKALSQTGIIPIQEAYIERAGTTRPGKLLNYFLGIPGGGSIAIEGKPGVGKTTFVNYYKYLWKTKSRKEKLFSSETEISVQGNWDTETFILSALGSLCGQLKLELGDSKVNRNKLLKEILELTSVLLQSDRGLSATALGFGASISKSTSVTLGKQTENSLSDYLRRLVSYIQTLGYNGAIIHFNNMDLLQKDKDCDLHSLFDSIRDVLQISGLYFVFVGTIGLYSSVIIPLDRVRSIFYDEPIVIDPFSEGQVVSLINIITWFKSVTTKQDIMTPGLLSCTIDAVLRVAIF